MGLVLSFMLLQLLSLAVVLMGQTISQRAYSRGRRSALLALVIVIAIAVIPAVRSRPSVYGAAQQLRQSMPARVLLAPFDVFANVVTAESVFPDMVKWSGIAILILIFLFALVMRLDAQYLELSAAAGQRLHARVQRMRRSGGMALRPNTGSARLRLPMLPRLGGAGR